MTNRDFSEIYYATNYSSDQDNLIDDFYKPTITRSVSYDRVSGYFSTSIKQLLETELLDFCQRGGIMRLICSEQLNEPDQQEIFDGYDMRSILENKFTTDLDRIMSDPIGEKALSVISFMIANGNLDIKIAIKRDGKGIFHQKYGSFYDEKGNILTFNGSINETYAGWTNNEEQFAVYQNWGPQAGVMQQYSEWYIKNFDSLWNTGHNTNISVFSFTEITKTLLENRYGKVNFSEACTLLEEFKEAVNYRKHHQELSTDNSKPHLIRDHQARAVAAWRNNNYRGIYKHCTGSGKTYSALLSIDEWIGSREASSVLVVVPSTLLMEQWSKELSAYFETRGHPLKTFNSGIYKYELDEIYPATKSNKYAPPISVVTIQTAFKPEFLSRIANDPNLLLVIDEVHWSGAESYSTILDTEAGGRLGLSATPERHMDNTGTEKIMSYFDGIVDNYSISDAIKDGFLCEYQYLPKRTSLQTDELIQWQAYTKELMPYFTNSSNSEPSPFKALPSWVTTKLFQRADIVKGAKNKIELANSILKEAQNNDRWIVYCDDEHQLNLLNELLQSKNIDAMIYHSNMQGNREATLAKFRELGGIILSNKMLDEGIDIPEVSHALVMASSQNSREYIQRRGRVLRRSEGKNLATIYDTLVLPDQTQETDNQHSIIKHELKRAYHFASDAQNKIEAQHILRTWALELGIYDLDQELDLDPEENEREE